MPRRQGSARLASAGRARTTSPISDLAVRPYRRGRFPASRSSGGGTSGSDPTVSLEACRARRTGGSPGRPEREQGRRECGDVPPDPVRGTGAPSSSPVFPGAGRRPVRAHGAGCLPGPARPPGSQRPWRVSASRGRRRRRRKAPDVRERPGGLSGGGGGTGDEELLALDVRSLRPRGEGRPGRRVACAGAGRSFRADAGQGRRASAWVMASGGVLGASGSPAGGGPGAWAPCLLFGRVLDASALCLLGRAERSDESRRSVRPRVVRGKLARAASLDQAQASSLPAGGGFSGLCMFPLEAALGLGAGAQATS